MWKRAMGGLARAAEGERRAKDEVGVRRARELEGASSRREEGWLAGGWRGQGLPAGARGSGPACSQARAIVVERSRRSVLLLSEPAPGRRDWRRLLREPKGRGAAEREVSVGVSEVS